MQKTYLYKKQTESALFVLIMGLGFSGFFINLAMTNDRGLIINRILEFSATHATYLYGFLGGIFSLTTISGLLMLIQSLANREDNYLVLYETYFTAPKTTSSKQQFTVKYSKITQLKLKTLKETHILYVYFDNEKITLSQGAFGRENFLEILTFFKNKAPCQIEAY